MSAVILKHGDIGPAVKEVRDRLVHLEVRVAHERAMHADDAHAVLDGEQRAGGGFWQRETRVKERGGLREHALHGLGGDEPGLAGEKRIKCGHAPLAVSTTAAGS